jgi:hypothetical protein
MNANLKPANFGDHSKYFGIVLSSDVAAVREISNLGLQNEQREWMLVTYEKPEEDLLGNANLNLTIYIQCYRMSMRSHDLNRLSSHTSLRFEYFE